MDASAYPTQSDETVRCSVKACRGHAPVLILLLIVLVFNAATLSAQSLYPLVISGGAHALTLPWYPGQITKRLNPSLTVGTERTLRHGRYVRLYHTANLGFFRHYWWMTGMFVDTELGIRRTLPYGFHADLKAGVGYLHYFWRRKSLELKDGKYVPATDWGRPSAMLPLSIVLGHRGSTIGLFAFSPFVTTQWVIQAPFIEEAPAMTHLFILFGVRIDRLGAAPSGGR